MVGLAFVEEKSAPIFKLAGMEVLSPSQDDAKSEFAKTVSRDDIALLIVSTYFIPLLKEDIENIRATNKEMVILEIESYESEYKAGDRLMKYIREVIGQA